MSRKLIDRDALIASIPKTNVDIFENCRNCSTLMDWEVKELIDKMPTIDAVEVVRCKDCKYGMTGHGIADGLVMCSKPYATDTVGGAMHRCDWFCGDGKRKEQNDEE